MNPAWVKWLPRRLRAHFRGRRLVLNVLGNSGWLLFDYVFRLGLGLVVTVWIARYLGPERLGMLNYAIAIVSLFSVTATLGLENIVVKHLVEEPSTQNEILATTILLRLLGSLACLALSGIAYWFLKPGDGIGLVIILIVAAVNLFRGLNSVEYWFRSELLQKHVVINRVLSLSLASSFRIAFILLGLDTEYFALALLLESGALAYLNLRDFRRLSKISLDSGSVRLRRAMELLDRSWMLALSEIVVAMYMRADHVFLGYYFGNLSVGVYSIGVQVSEVFYFLPIILIASLYPPLVRIYSDNEDHYNERLIQILCLVFWTTLVISMIVSLSSDLIVNAIFGPAYADSAKVVSWYVLVLPVVSIAVVIHHRYILKGRLSHMLIGTTVGAVASVTLCFFLIPKLGISGALVAGVTGQLVPTIFISLFLDRSVGIIILRSLIFDSRFLR